MKTLFVLLKRDCKNSINKKFFFLLIFMALFQMWFISGSDSVNQVKATQEMSFMAVVFSFNFFGSIVALALNYNGISNERETKVLDLILTSNISKKKVYSSKIISSILTSAAFAFIYTLIIMFVYLIIIGDFSLSLMTLRYIIPITAFLSIFSLMGLMLSVIFRSSKASLITSLIIGGLLIPRIFIMIVDGFNSLAGLSQQVVDIIYMISPALILNALNGYEPTSIAMWGILMLGLYLIIITIVGMSKFVKQDELNYGE